MYRFYILPPHMHWMSNRLDLIQSNVCCSPILYRERVVFPDRHPQIRGFDETSPAGSMKDGRTSPVHSQTKADDSTAGGAVASTNSSQPTIPVIPDTFDTFFHDTQAYDRSELHWKQNTSEDQPYTLPSQGIPGNLRESQEISSSGLLGTKKLWPL